MSRKKDKNPEEKEQTTLETGQPDEQNTEPKTDGTPETDVQAEPTTEELLAAEHEKLLRLAAEYDNYRKRSQKERETLYSEIKAETASKFLSVYDNVVRACEEASGETEPSRHSQVFDMLKRQIEGIYGSAGVEIISSGTETGKIFDPERHNAILKVPSDSEHSENTVAFVIQSGCAAGGKVIKHADVGIYSVENEKGGNE